MRPLLSMTLVACAGTPTSTTPEPAALGACALAPPVCTTAPAVAPGPLADGAAEAFTVADRPGGLGDVLAPVGDVDGDGCADLGAVGADGLYVFRGPLGPGAYGLADADWHVGWTPLQLETLPGGVLPVGDADCDGTSDLVFRERLFTGPLAADVPETAGAPTAASPWLALDLDGDALLDAVRLEDTSVLVSYGPLSPTFDPLADPPRGVVVDGVCAAARLESLGDLTGDGSPELFVGASAYTAALSECASPASQILDLSGAAPAALAGGDGDVHAVGDLTGDGTPELFLSTAGGDAVVLDGAATRGEWESLAPLLEIRTPGGGFQASGRVVGVDPDGDGLSSLVVAWGAAIWVIQPETRGVYTLADHTPLTTSLSEIVALDSPGADYTGDGVPDVWATEPLSSPETAQRVAVISGSTLTD